nr:PREDICTED: uncharacterized protein LOC100877350 [Megachile rotundata]
MLPHKVLRIFVNLFVILNFVTGEILLNKNEKRTTFRNGYQMCFNSFKTQENKIIQTQESRSMGATYLKEIDVNSRNECLQFCCDTKDCDVFIFEEKKPGSCYLFQCGPLDDFKCKFTNHANYSSSIRINYNTQSNEEGIRISQQEHELKSLRNLADTAPAQYSFTEPSTKLVATLAPKPLTTAPPVKQGCSRYQYECRSSGDCIAEYNVCDGIPQCADESDEDHCPTERPTLPPVIQGAQPPPPLLPIDNIKYQQMVEQNKFPVPQYAHQEVNSWMLPNSDHQMIPRPISYPGQPMEVYPVHKDFGTPRYQLNLQPVYDQAKDVYSPVIPFHEQSNLNRYEHQPHSFNHKGPNVMGEKETDSGAYLEERHPYISHYGSPNRASWQNTQIFPSPSPISNLQQKQVDEVENTVASTIAPPCDIPNEQKYIPKDKEIVKVHQQEEKHAVHEKEMKQKNDKSHAVKHETPTLNHAKGKEPKEHKSVIVIKDHSTEHGRNTITADFLKQLNDIEVLKPRGAVISLALGLTITAITATLIACRLRVVRRRRRRHGSYAHDADYLVNGMYL